MSLRLFKKTDMHSQLKVLTHAPFHLKFKDGKSASRTILVNLVPALIFWIA
jgi:hypothetical protein